MPFVTIVVPKVVAEPTPVDAAAPKAPNLTAVGVVGPVQVNLKFAVEELMP